MVDFIQQNIRAEDDLTLANITAETRTQNVVYVRKNPAPGQFSSLKDAIDSIVTATSSNAFQVVVGPGIFIEDTITMKPWVFVRGNRNSTIIQVNDPSKDVIVACEFSEIHECVIDGATDSGSAGVRVSSTIGGLFQVRECLFGSNNILVHIDAAVFGQITVLDTLTTSVSQFDKAMLVNGTGVCVGSFIGFNALIGSGMNVTSIYEVSSPTSQANISTSGVVVAGSGTVTNGLLLFNGAKVAGHALAFSGVDNAVVTQNTGAAPDIQFGGITVMDSSTSDLSINHPGTTGFVTGAFDTDKISIDSSSSLSVAYADPTADVGTAVVGSLLQGDTFDKLANISKLLRQTAAMGHFSGGAITDAGGLTVDVALGEGFITDGSGVVREVEWAATTGLVLNASSSSFITVNSSGTVQASSGTQDITQKIILGSVITDATSIVGLVDVPLNVVHHSNSIEIALESGLGPLYTSGTIVSEKNIGSRDLAITSGMYFLGSRQISPQGQDPASWTSFRRNGGGGFITGSQSIVDNANYDDNSGSLVAIPAGEFVKHSLYVVGLGASSGYFLVYGQTTFNSLSAAETGPLPTPPGFFDNNVVIVASLIVEQGINNIQTILDERPQLSKQASAVSPSSDHGNLSGLGDDDHLQYFRTDGGRVATGNFNMGTNDITNVGNVDGVDVSAHANRHLPNGSDPLATGSPLSSLGGTSSNAEGVANSMARSDHSHDVATGTPSTLNPDLANAEGTGNELARADHIHNIPAATAVSLDASSVNAEGVSTSFARADHTHNIGTALVGEITTINAGDSANAGSSNNFSRGDHQHAVSIGSPITITPDQANDQGVSTSLARADHVHNLGASAPTTNLTANTTNTEGSSNDLARADHIHAIDTGTAVTIDLSSTNTEGTSANLARADHTHNIDLAFGTPSTINPDQPNAEGVSTSISRADHIHNIPAATAITITDSTNAEGVSTSFARADHSHSHGNRGGGSLHALVTPSVNGVGGTAGFMSATDKEKLNRHQRGHLQYSNSAILTRALVTYAALALDTNQGSFPLNQWTKVNTTDFRADFTGSARISYSVDAWPSTQNRAFEVGIAVNGVIVPYTERQATAQSTSDRRNTVAWSGIVPVTTNDIITLRFASPETAVITVEINSASMCVDTYRIGTV